MVNSVEIRRKIVKNLPKIGKNMEPTWSTSYEKDEDENYKHFRDRLADGNSEKNKRLLNLSKVMLEATLRKLLKDLAKTTEELSDELSFRDELKTVNEMLLLEKVYLESKNKKL